MRESYSLQEETRDLQGRIYRLLILIGIALFSLLFRAWYLQIIQGKYYLELSENNRIRVIETPPPRGLIYDRNGTLLVNNVPSFNLYAVPGDMPDSGAVFRRLSDLIGINDEEVLQRMASRRDDPYLPIKIKNDLPMREVALVEGHGLELPGIKIEPEFKRNALYGSMAAHLLGYVGEITQPQLETGFYLNMKRGGIIGQFGVEQTFDSILRGTPGQKRVEVDALGHEVRTMKLDEPLRGDDIFLTIDLNLQKTAEEALGGRGGAIVALDSRTGEVLAMVSHPAFDPNLLSQGAASRVWEAILKDEGRPLNNRAIQGQYPPGSTYKIVVGAALLETKTTSPSQQVECRGFLPFGNRNFRDWKKTGHGTVDFHRALVESCDVYFYEMGPRLGIDTISKFSHLFGLGHTSGIELAFEKGGLIPSSEWKQRTRKEPWYPGETLSVAIGQGYVTVTPLQQTIMIATVANKGVLNPPKLLKRIRDYETGKVREIPSAPGEKIPLSAETIRELRNALAGVVSDSRGTAKGSRSEFVSIAGKTGTAQVVGMKGGSHGKLPEKLNDHAWFVAFAPFENSKIAVTVLVENGGHGGATAAPLAKKVIETYLGFGSSPETVATRGAISSRPTGGNENIGNGREIEGD
ncbi:MAG: penicillin-binding protein 2 [Candidatus Manganitrophaceae bacterium]